MDDSETLQLAQQFELVDVAESGAELESVNWVFVQSKFIREIFIMCSGVRRQGQEIGEGLLTEDIEITHGNRNINEELGGFRA
jgi:hypothetical protein